MASRGLLNRWRGRIMIAQSALRIALGVALSLFGILVLTGQDRVIGIFLERLSPDWLTRLTTSF